MLRDMLGHTAVIPWTHMETHADNVFYMVEGGRRGVRTENKVSWEEVRVQSSETSTGAIQPQWYC